MTMEQIAKVYPWANEQEKSSILKMHERMKVFFEEIVEHIDVELYEVEGFLTMPLRDERLTLPAESVQQILDAEDPLEEFEWVMEGLYEVHEECQELISEILSYDKSLEYSEVRDFVDMLQIDTSPLIQAVKTNNPELAQVLNKNELVA